MKKYVHFTALLILAVSFQSFKVNISGKPKLFADIEKFYADLSTASKNKQPSDGVHNLYSGITAGIVSEKPVNILFACSDNSFRSLAAQIISQSLVSVNKYNKIFISSCGYQSAEVNPLLLKVLQRHGFIVTEQPNSATGKKTYEIKFGTDMNPLIIYTKQKDDVAVPKSIFLQLKMCSAGENNCIDMEAAKFKAAMNYDNTKDITSEDELDKEFTAIASDILWAFNEAKL